MTRITFFRSDGVLYGFKETGHTGLSEEGSDILCSAISAMTMLIINAIIVTYESDADYTIDEETTDITVIVKGALGAYEKDEKKQYAISGLITAYYNQLTELTEEYHEYLSVTVVDKDLKE
ncbi:MAG: ribosomal-processing cysteine protease Prp [Clostridia bacterium]|nr:ribosomal-processing cysteine protease Prp [Clostridia bacterium]